MSFKDTIIMYDIFIRNKLIMTDDYRKMQFSNVFKITVFEELINIFFFLLRT